MATYTITRTLDLLKHNGDAGAIPPVVMRRGDKGAVIQGLIRFDGDAFNLTGYTSRFLAVNPAGEIVARSATVTDAAGGVVTYAVTTDLTAVTGPVLVAYFEFVKDGETATTDTIPVIVLENANLDAETATEYESTIDSIMSRLEAALLHAEEATAAANAAAANAAEEAQAASAGASAVEEALDAVGDISELAVPLMSAGVRGGARLGSGLSISDGALTAGMYLETETLDGVEMLVLVYDDGN